MRRIILVSLLCLWSAPASAAIVVTEKIFEGTTTDGTSFTTTATWSVTTNTLGICFVGATDSVLPSTLTVSQTGQTWDAIDATNAMELFDVVATPLKRIQAFRTLGAGAAAAAIVVTGDAGTGNQTSFWAMCAELSGIDTSGTNGSGAIIQSKDGSADDTVDPTVTFGSARTANSAVLAAIGSNACIWTGEYTEANSGTELVLATPGTEAFYMYIVGPADESPTWSTSGCTPEWGMIAVEVKEAAAGGGGGTTSNLLLLGVGE